MTHSASTSGGAGDEIRSVVEAAATRVFHNYGTLHQRTATSSEMAPRIDETAWGAMVDAGLHCALLGEEHGGVGIDNGFSVARLCGAHALEIPLVETLAANWLMNQAGLPITNSPCSIAEQTMQVSTLNKQRLSGMVYAVPWGRACNMVFLAARGKDQYLVHLRSNQYTVQPHVNLAGEPRDTCIFDATIPSEEMVALPDTWDPQCIRLLGAALRAAQMAGAIESVLEMTVRYAGERRQFGRSIGSFQAVQQLLASMATQTAAASAAADLAAEAVGSNLDAWAIAVAKSRVGEAASAVAAGAHQIHGALGFTREYGLHKLTRRLWAWRDEYGSEAAWSMLLGQRIAEAGPNRLWAVLTEI
jgi:acyl-CoA dehydrogenase